MKFLAVVLISLVGVVYCDTCPPDKAVYEENSNVICISKTEFMLKEATEPIKCPTGTVCAAVAEICSATAPSVCSNEVIGGGSCNQCINNDPHKICISDTEYAICNYGSVLKALTYSCGSGTFCKIDPNNPGEMCVADSADIDCPVDNQPETGDGNGGEPETGPGTGNGGGGTTRCTAEGLFPDPADTLCVKYYKCTKTSSGEYATADFQCSMKDYHFNPKTKRCELDYECPK